MTLKIILSTILLLIMFIWSTKRGEVRFIAKLKFLKEEEFLTLTGAKLKRELDGVRKSSQTTYSAANVYDTHGFARTCP